MISCPIDINYPYQCHHDNHRNNNNMVPESLYQIPRKSIHPSIPCPGPSLLRSDATVIDFGNTYPIRTPITKIPTTHSNQLWVALMIYPPPLDTQKPACCVHILTHIAFRRIVSGSFIKHFLNHTSTATPKDRRRTPSTTRIIKGLATDYRTI